MGTDARKIENNVCIKKFKTVIRRLKGYLIF